MSASDAWRLFPFPTSHLDSGLHLDGALIPRSQTCTKCVDRPCESNPTAFGEVATCKYGMHYSTLNPNVVLQGVVVGDANMPTKHSRRRWRSEPDARIHQRQLDRALEALAELASDAVNDFSLERDRAVAEALGQAEVRKAIVADLSEHLTDRLHQSHDFIQLLRQVRGHIVTILEERFPGHAPEEAAEKLESEGAIFFATELMLAKLDATLYLIEPNRAFGDETQFQVHRLITKYFRIYRSQAQQKNVDIRTVGASYGSVHYNAAAIGAIVHALLDNCVKYAPSGSKADIDFAEDDETIRVEFSSYGPRILPTEKDRIFTPGYRAAAARSIESSGLGFGLAAARQISDMLDLDLSVNQRTKESSQFPGCYPVAFTLRLNRSDKIP